MKRLIKRASLPTIKDFYPNSDEFDYVNIGTLMVLVNNIVGLSEGRVNDYNDDWTPINKNDSRWKRAYDGYKNSESIPPVPLIKMPNGKFCANGDGSHRISAAKVLGIDQIRAKIIEMVPNKLGIQTQWEDYSRDKQEQLDQLHEQYNNITKDIYKAQDENNPELEKELINKQNQIGQKMNSLDIELEKEEKEFKENLLNNKQVAK